MMSAMKQLDKARDLQPNNNKEEQWNLYTRKDMVVN